MRENTTLEMRVVRLSKGENQLKYAVCENVVMEDAL